MAITSLPDGIVDLATLTCAICSVKLELSKATAGLFDKDGRQAFACVSHFSEVEKLITGWADYMAAQRQGATLDRFKPQNMYRGQHNEHINY